MKKLQVLARRLWMRLLSRTMQIFIISDCTDVNVLARYKAAFFRECPRSIIECVPTKHVLEAAGTGVDLINELRGQRGAVFINFAPRRDADKKNGLSNGPDFVYFFVGKTLVVTSNTPSIFGVLHHFGVPYENIRLIDCNDDRFEKTQFRSGQIIPLVVKEILTGEYVGQQCEVENQCVKNRIWFVDNFGNCKTTIRDGISGYFARSLHLDDKFVFFNEDKLPYYYGLTDVPDGTPACIYGSSGYQDESAAELVIKGGSFAKRYGVKVGDEIIIKSR